MVIGETLHPLHKHGHLPGKKQDLPNVCDNEELREYIGTSPPAESPVGRCWENIDWATFTPSTL